MKGCLTKSPVLKPIFSALAIASSVVPVLLQSSLNFLKFGSLTKFYSKDGHRKSNKTSAKDSVWSSCKYIYIILLI